MSSVIIIGDGPGGLSAGLFLAKNGHEVTLFGTDQTAMNYAYLHNYLGIPGISGTKFQSIARNQVESFGVRILDEEVTSVATENGFSATTASGTTAGDYLILSEGKSPQLALSLGLETDDAGAIVVNRDYKSSADRVYVLGRSTRPERSQAIISAGAGATAALDILAAEEGKNVQDWDTPPE